MKRVTILWTVISCLLFSQYDNTEYPDWFLETPADKYVAGFSENISDESATLIGAYLDAMAMHELMQNGMISTNIIAHNSRLAESLDLSLDSLIVFPDSVYLNKYVIIKDLFIGLFHFINGKKDVRLKKELSNSQRIVAIGKQTIHPDRIYESWASAEIEAFKELSRIKKSRIQSIVKYGTYHLKKLIFLQSESYFTNARIDQRWVKNNVAYVKVSDDY